MEGFISFLLFGGLFLLLMRYGCGAHVMHGGHSHGNKANARKTDHVDPVCGMTVDPNKGYGRMHEEQLYFFCSRTCLDKFEADTSRYVGAKQIEDQS